MSNIDAINYPVSYIGGLSRDPAQAINLPIHYNTLEDRRWGYNAFHYPFSIRTVPDIKVGYKRFAPYLQNDSRVGQPPPPPPPGPPRVGIPRPKPGYSPY